MAKSFKSPPAWAFVSLATNGLLILTVPLLLLKDDRAAVESQIKILPVTASRVSDSSTPQLGPRQQLTYEQWVDLLSKEAKAAAENKPDRLTVLAGDSLSLWFPSDLLPVEQTWLNQSISGETSAGLLRRLKLFDQTKPQAIFLMVGINDLLKDISDEEILNHHREIVQTLKQAHPQAKIVVQSILPHSGGRATLIKRSKLLELSNERIHALNQRIAAIAQEADVDYLDLQPLFVDPEGYLRPELTTDGLHLSREGYLVWRSAIETFSQLRLKQKEE